MKVLMISTDRQIFSEGSDVRRRMKEYGALSDELHILVYTARFRHPFRERRYQLAPNVWAYPTRSLGRWFYIADAVRVGRRMFRAGAGGAVLMPQDPFETGLAACLLSWWYKVPMIVQVHTDVFSPHYAELSLVNKVRAKLAPAILKRARLIRAVSARVAESVRSVLKNDAIPIRVLPIFVDVEKIVNEFPHDIDLSLRYKQFGFIVLMASRLEPEKDVETGLAAFKDVVARYPDTGLVVAGGGSREKRLKRGAERLGIGANVIFEPRVSKLVSYYKTSHAFLNTSLYEGYGMTLLEAAASGAAIVTTDVGIAGELLVPGRDAYVCPVKDAGCVAGRLLELIEKDNSRRMLQRNARRAAEEAAISREEYLRRYREMLESI